MSISLPRNYDFYCVSRTKKNRVLGIGTAHHGSTRGCQEIRGFNPSQCDDVYEQVDEVLFHV